MMDPRDFIHFFNMGLAVVCFGFAIYKIDKAVSPYRWMKLTLAADSILILISKLIFVIYGDAAAWVIDVSITWVLSTMIGALLIGLARNYFKK